MHRRPTSTSEAKNENEWRVPEVNIRSILRVDTPIAGSMCVVNYDTVLRSSLYPFVATDRGASLYVHLHRISSFLLSVQAMAFW